DAVSPQRATANPERPSKCQALHRVVRERVQRTFACPHHPSIPIVEGLTLEYFGGDFLALFDLHVMFPTLKRADTGIVAESFSRRAVHAAHGVPPIRLHKSTHRYPVPFIHSPAWTGDANARIITGIPPVGIRCFPTGIESKHRV